MEVLQWDNCHEGNTLQQSAKVYCKRVATRKRSLPIRFTATVKERNIRLSGLKLGRPFKYEPEEQNQLAHKTRHNTIESKLGEDKRHNRLRSIQVQQTGETVMV